ncbi:putative aspartyl/asparaginyl beta-hydroxylase [Anabaenopsis circularis NIES-21]|uniref:Beta-alanine--pyruvate aminotransferase n=2 Tax=Nostocales TaxID=1161 RepID=A0A2H6LJ10_9NOSO|nr:aspartyl/asparaginyl beta-hydroxylase domain-containing protein [Nostoc cycadae]BAY15296.1 putative aspartyl/asparaginyl beta-hydroxylase [Anabaenopsis circularis NIES-21]GBE93210.1 beta-alanine--pyruvate aminotransferase [Nostoc cycadae WK-1]
MLQSNSPQITLSLWLLKLLNFLYPQGNAHRFQESINLISQHTANSNGKISDFVYPGITYKPWYEADDYNSLKQFTNILKQDFSTIENEWQAFLASKKNIVPRYKPSEIFGETLKDQDENWKYYLIWRQGKFTDAALSMFPKTVNIVTKLKPFLYPFGEIVFIVMEPGVVLPPHTDDINISLTCHLGIETPEDCGIKVGGETRKWSRGEALFFDNSFIHEAWNKSQSNRVVMLLDLYHPELTKVEKTLLQIALKYFNLTGEEAGYHGVKDTKYLQEKLKNLY